MVQIVADGARRWCPGRVWAISKQRPISRRVVDMLGPVRRSLGWQQIALRQDRAHRVELEVVEQAAEA
jgi:hypothetical protein